MSQLSELQDSELVKKRARVIFWNSIAAAILVLYLITSTTLQLISSVQGDETRRTLLDCVEPEGRCFKEGEARTALVVQQLINANQLDEVATRRIVILAAACSKLPTAKTVADVEQCVNKRLVQDKGTK